MKPWTWSEPWYTLSAIAVGLLLVLPIMLVLLVILYAH